MKIDYNLDLIINNLDLYNLQGLIKIILNLNPKLLKTYSEQYIDSCTISELEKIYKSLFCGDAIDSTDKISVERLMLSCARENVIGF